MRNERTIWSRVTELSVHGLIWLLLFALNYLFMKNFRITFDVVFHMKVWAIFILFFYLNYSLLMPFFLFRKKFILYSVSILIIFTCSFYVKLKIESSYFARIFTEKNEVLDTSPEPPRSMDNFAENPLFDRMKDKHDPQHRQDNFKGLHREHRFMADGPPGGRGFGSFFGLMLIFTASTSIRFMQKWQDDENKKAVVEKEKVSNELAFLKQQINPHFLFNALNNIYALTINKPVCASEALLKLSAMLRYMLYETENTFVPLREELSVTENYIELQKLRLTEKVSVKFIVNGIIGEYKIPPLLLIPIIENAFKHGIDNINDSFIDVLIEITEGDIILQVRNKMVQLSSFSHTGSGIGIKNIRRRLDLLYPGNYSLEIENKADVYSVLLKIKLSV